MTMLLLTLILGFALPPAEEVRDPQWEVEIAINEGVAAALKPVVDDATAQKSLTAMMDLERRQGRLSAIRGLIGPISPEYRAALQKKYGAALDASRMASRQQVERVAKIPAALAVFEKMSFFAEFVKQ
jgi:hypothetical protein